MDKALELIENLFNLSKDQQIFFIAITALLVVGISLFVVLAALSKLSDKRGIE